MDQAQVSPGWCTGLGGTIPTALVNRVGLEDNLSLTNGPHVNVVSALGYTLLLCLKEAYPSAVAADEPLDVV